ncbi:hypothetical protein EIP91_000858 [Steccherinum ochraceum]|uniref:Uncharacterized protein n=1 Tax=Steccherinum ochraceum TaxID=92696 RepID=A0A4R0RUT3_9APHY|nr:hypothetical protein EIP91_000858 [Steccherinum ochraceum]
MVSGSTSHALDIARFNKLEAQPPPSRTHPLAVNVAEQFDDLVTRTADGHDYHTSDEEDEEEDDDDEDLSQWQPRENLPDRYLPTEHNSPQTRPPLSNSDYPCRPTPSQPTPNTSKSPSPAHSLP